MKLVLSALVLLALTWTALLLSGVVSRADFMRVEWVLAVVMAIGAVASWRRIARRRERQRLEAMRDSALW